VVDVGRTGFHVLGDGTTAVLGPVFDALNRAAGLDHTAAERFEAAAIRDGVAAKIAGRVEFDAELPLSLGAELADLGIAAATLQYRPIGGKNSCSPAT
jgi:hypothetical protein